MGTFSARSAQIGSHSRRAVPRRRHAKPILLVFSFTLLNTARRRSADASSICRLPEKTPTDYHRGRVPFFESH